MKVIKKPLATLTFCFIGNPGPYVVINPHDTTRSDEDFSDFPVGNKKRPNSNNGNLTKKPTSK